MTLNPITIARRYVGRKARDFAVRFSGYGGGATGTGWGSGRWPFWELKPPGAKYDYKAEAGDLWRNTAVAIALRWIKINFPEPRPAVYTRHGGAKREVTGHPAIDLVESPNEFYDGDALWGAVSLSYEVEGNAYLLKGQTLDGATKQFYYVPHWQMFPRWPTDGSQFISHYEYIVDGIVYPLRRDQVVHFRNGLDPLNPRYGLSELAIAVREICTDNEAASYCAALLRNMGIPGYIISPESDDDQIDGPERDDLKRLWREKFTGEGRGEPLVNSVRLKIDQVSLSPDKLVLDKIRQVPEARIVAAIGLRASTLGISVGNDQKSYKNSIEDRRAGYEDCLIPLQKSLAKQLTRQCPELFKRGQFLGWDYREVQALREDETEKVKRAVVGYQGGLVRRNEAREQLGMEPVPGGNAFSGEDEQGNPKSPLAGAVPSLGHNSLGSDE